MLLKNAQRFHVVVAVGGGGGGGDCGVTMLWSMLA